MVDPRCRVKRVSGFSSAHFSFDLHTSGRLSDHGISSSRKSVVLSSMCGIIVSSTCLKYVVGTQSVRTGCFRDAVQNPTGFRSVLCSRDLPVLFLFLNLHQHKNISIICRENDGDNILNTDIAGRWTCTNFCDISTLNQIR